jgi:hypothetical protein
MFSESSEERFVFRGRETPEYDSTCVKMTFHIQSEERETEILTLVCRVFDDYTPNFICVFQNVCQGLRCENRPVNRPVNRDTGLEMTCSPVTDLLWV